MNFDVTIYTSAARVKPVDRFDFGAYMEARRKRIVEQGEPGPCHTLETRCSGCPAPRDELCFRYEQATATSARTAIRMANLIPLEEEAEEPRC